MDLYTLTDQFLDKDPVDEFVSVIWTERYSSIGDVQLVLPATAENISKLADGTFLALRGTKEVMEIQTQSIEGKLMTVTGVSLVGVLDQRLAWFKNPDYDSGDPNSPLIVDYTDNTKKPGEFLSDVVDKMVINPVTFSGAYAPTNLNWEYEVVPHLELGDIDTSGTVKRLTIPIGSLYNGIANLAQEEKIGFSLYLDSADELVGYILKFVTYQGKDRTRDQAVNQVIRLLPDMESLSEIKEIRSRSNYKNVAYVYYKGIITEHLAEPTLPPPEGFARRVLVTDAEGEPVGRKVTGGAGTGFYGGGGWSNIVVGPTELADFKEQNAKDALANHNYIQAIDGQASPNIDYKYGIDYGLGDIIELEGITGAVSKARITEYIRAQDSTGEKEYPTISVISEGG